MKNYLYLLDGKWILSICNPKTFAQTKLVNQFKQAGTVFFEIDKKICGITETTKSRWLCVQPNGGFVTTKTEAFKNFYIVGKHGQIINFVKKTLDPNEMKEKVMIFLDIMRFGKHGYFSKLEPNKFGEIMISKERKSVLKRMFFAELDQHEESCIKAAIKEKIVKFAESEMDKKMIWSNISDLPLRIFKDFYLVTRGEPTVIFTLADDKDQTKIKWQDTCVF